VAFSVAAGIDYARGLRDGAYAWTIGWQK